MEFCVNKDKPEMQCNGKCHLAKQVEMETEVSVSINTKTKQKDIPRNKIRLIEEVLFFEEIEMWHSVHELEESSVTDHYVATFSEKSTLDLIKPPGA